jgi:hypothetical protein
MPSLAVGEIEIVHVRRLRPIGLRNRTRKVTCRGHGQAQSLASIRVYHHVEWPRRSGANVQSVTSLSTGEGVSVAVGHLLAGMMWEAHIRVRLVHKGVEHLHSLPDAHPGAATALEVYASLDIERDSLFFCSRQANKKMR